MLNRVILAGLLLFVSLPAMAQPEPPSKTAFRAWDACVGESAQEYADMFGAMSMNDDKLDKALEDCWDEEFNYQETVRRNPELSDAAMNGLFDARKAEIRAKWRGVYVKNGIRNRAAATQAGVHK